MTLRDVRPSLTRTYLTFDGRSLALCRVVLGSVLIVDLFRRVRWIRDFYSNDGLLPNHTVLWQPPQPRAFSLFLMASRPDESAVGFAIAFCCFFFLLIGFRCRLFHVLSFVMTTSLHCRILFAENGGAVALGALVFWTAFLPMGRRFSVDSLISSLRDRHNEGPRDLLHTHRPIPDTRPAASLAVLAILLQLGVIYAFNFVHKSGATWRTGTAVHYVLQQERIVTYIGLWARKHLPFAVTKGLTYGTLAVEAAAPFLILSPIFRPICRALAIVLLTGLHGGIAVLVNLGIFSAAMIAYYPLLVDTAHWDWVARRIRRRPRTVFYDAECGICFQIIRVLSRLDVSQDLTFVSNQDVASLPVGAEPAILTQTVLVTDPATGQMWTRSDAFAEMFACLPGGRACAWVLRVPGLRAAAGRAYDAFSRRRTAVSVWLGLAACAVPQATSRAFSSDETNAARAIGPHSAPVWAWTRSQLAVLRELGVALALCVAAADLSVSNSALPVAWRWDKRPDWMAAAVMYTHVAEGWGMFAPEAPIYDEMVVIDAVTRDGRHVDPYNEVGSRVHSLPVNDIPERLGHDSFFCDYTLRIPGAGAYHQALSEWIVRYPARTGNPSDAIVSFEAYKLEHTPPGPGHTVATNVRRTLFLKWPSDGR